MFIEKIEAKLMTDKERAKLMLQKQLEPYSKDQQSGSRLSRIKDSLKRIDTLITDLKKKPSHLRLVKPGEKPQLPVIDETKLSNEDREKYVRHDLQILKAPMSKKQELLEKRTKFIEKVLKKYGSVIVKRAV